MPNREKINAKEPKRHKKWVGKKIETWTIPITQIKLEYKKGTILWNPLKKSIFLKRDLFVTIHGRRFEVGAFGDFEKVEGSGLLSGNVGQLGTKMSHKDNVVNIVVVGIVFLFLFLFFMFLLLLLLWWWMWELIELQRWKKRRMPSTSIPPSSYTAHIHSLFLNLRHSNTPLLLYYFIFFPLFSSLF